MIGRYFILYYYNSLHVVVLCDYNVHFLCSKRSPQRQLINKRGNIYNLYANESYNSTKA
jgi:hypothetical protein